LPSLRPLVSDPPKDGFAVANKTERVLDFGYCLLRMNVGVSAVTVRRFEEITDWLFLPLLADDAPLPLPAPKKVVIHVGT
jgi:hypothetical protein